MTGRRRDQDRRRRPWWPLLVVVVTAGYATVPYLIEGFFYQRGDTAVQFAPTWYHLGELVRSGSYPPTMDADAWQGGNYAAEALHGVYNPLNVLVWLLVSASNDLMLATLAVKVTVLSLLALGIYFLAREYDAEPWAAAAMATALPFSGFTLFWEAGSWPSGLIAFAYTPWVWLTFRRVRRGASNPFWGFVVGALAITQGNPYGTLAVVAVGASLLVEGLADGDRRGAGRLAFCGVTVASLLPLVYLPLLRGVDMAVRSGGPLFANTDLMRPGSGDLAALSAPMYVPTMAAVAGPMAVPTVYLSWIVLPLLPWLRWSVLRERWRSMLALPLVGVGYLLLTIGPSKLWLFRWPLRLVEYGFLAVGIAFAVLLSQGLVRAQPGKRLAASGAVVLAMSWMTFAEHPQDRVRAALGVVLLAGAVVLFLAVARLRPSATTALGLMVVLSTGAVLGTQVQAFGENAGSRYWHVPRDVSQMRTDFGDRDGRVIQLTDLKTYRRDGGRLEKAWADYLPGSLPQVAGVDAVNTYTGMGMRDFARGLCMSYDGLAKRCGYDALWASPTKGLPDLADQMKLQTVAVEPRWAEKSDVPAGWTYDKSTRGLALLTRDEPLPWPDSRVSVIPDGAVVTDASSGTADDRVTFDTTGDGGRTVFAAIAWEGWRGSFGGEPVAVGRTRNGLLTVDLPPGRVGELELSYVPPGQRGGLAVAGLGALLALGVGALHLRRRRTDGQDR